MNIFATLDEENTIFTFDTGNCSIKISITVGPCLHTKEEIETLLQGEDYKYQDCEFSIVQQDEETTFSLTTEEGTDIHQSSFSVTVDAMDCAKALRTWVENSFSGEGEGALPLNMIQIDPGELPKAELQSFAELYSMGFTHLPRNVSYEEMVKYLKNDVPSTAFTLISNCRGYFKIFSYLGRILLFDDFTDYGPKSLREITGDDTLQNFSEIQEVEFQCDIDTDENFHLRSCLLFRDWTDVEHMFPGEVQNDLNPVLASLMTTSGKERREKERMKYRGNTCLLKLKTPNRYRYVQGGYISEFTLDEPVLYYYSHVTSSYEPEPMIVTENYLYLPKWNCKVERKTLPPKLKSPENLLNKFPRYLYQKNIHLNTPKISDFVVVYDSDRRNEEIFIKTHPYYQLY